MIKIFSWLLCTFSFQCFAQEDIVEVGKYANPNLDALSMIMSLLMVLVVIVVSAWVLRKFNVVNKSVSGMKVITNLPLGNKEKLVVVEVGDEQLLLAVTSQQITLIKALDKPLELGEPMAQELGQTFSRLFVKKAKPSSIIKQNS